MVPTVMAIVAWGIQPIRYTTETASVTKGFPVRTINTTH